MHHDKERPFRFIFYFLVRIRCTTNLCRCVSVSLLTRQDPEDTTLLEVQVFYPYFFPFKNSKTLISEKLKESIAENNSSPSFYLPSTWGITKSKFNTYRLFNSFPPWTVRNRRQLNNWIVGLNYLQVKSALRDIITLRCFYKHYPSACNWRFPRSIYLNGRWTFH